MLASNTPHAQGKDLLEVIDALRLEQQVFDFGWLACDAFMDPGVVLNMLRNFGRFSGLLVIGGRNIVPRKFAQVHAG